MSLLTANLEQVLSGVPSITNCCNALKSMLSSQKNITLENIRPFHAALPSILGALFGNEEKFGWIHTIQNESDENALHSLLSPRSGPLFPFLLLYGNNRNCLIEVSFDKLPKSFQTGIHNQTAHQCCVLSEYLYKNNSKVCIQLNLFEYFIFHFASAVSPKSIMGNANPRFMRFYCKILESYLQYFLPFKSFSKETDSILSYQYGNSEKRLSFDVFSANLGLSKTFFKVICGIWLQRYTTITNSTTKKTELIYFDLPSNNILEAVEYLVSYVVAHAGDCLASSSQTSVQSTPSQKQFSHYSHSQQNSSNLYYHQSTETFNTFNNQILKILQYPLYNYIKYSIIKWPIDITLKKIISTWSIYIFPWKEDNVETSFSREWIPYLVENIPLYTVILKELLQRVNSRIDLPEIAHPNSELTLIALDNVKVLDFIFEKYLELANVLSIVEEIITEKESVFSSFSASSGTPKSVLRKASSNVSTSLRPSLAVFHSQLKSKFAEFNIFEEVDWRLFSEDSILLALKLLRKFSAAFASLDDSLNELKSKKAPDSSNALGKFFSFSPSANDKNNSVFTSDDYFKPIEDLLKYLHMLEKKIKDFFKIPNSAAKEEKSDRISSNLAATSANRRKHELLAEMTPNRHHLTKRGVYEIKAGMKICDNRHFTIKGTPRMIASYESKILLFIFDRLEHYINKKIGQHSFDFRVSLRFLAAPINLLWFFMTVVVFICLLKLTLF